MTKDAFDQWWEWANKPPESMLMMPAEIHEAVMLLHPDERKDRGKVNHAVQSGWRRGVARPPGSADQYGVPMAEE